MAEKNNTQHEDEGNKFKWYYCTQNNQDCKTCSLNNYGRDCQSNKILESENK